VHEKELESKLPEPEARKEAREQVERASNDLKEHTELVVCAVSQASRLQAPSKMEQPPNHQF
jgi:hypothetical protein